MSKFDKLFEEQIGQFVKSGPIAGDYVKFASNLKSSDWYKELSESRKAYVDEIATLAEQGKPLMLSTIKRAIYENPAKTIPGKDEGFNDQFADIVVEYAPGFYQQSLSLPLQLVELTLGKDEARATQKDPSNDQEDKSTLKPEEVEDPTIDIGQQTHVPDGDYKLSTERYLNT
tara:strand:- start:3062 stop:3580 length:519 start_codon:yes stop_codon:yes gene_type:complete